MTRHHTHDGRTYSYPFTANDAANAGSTTTRIRWVLAFGIALVFGMLGAAGAALGATIYPGSGAEFAVELQELAERLDDS